MSKVRFTHWWRPSATMKTIWRWQWSLENRPEATSQPDMLRLPDTGTSGSPACDSETARVQGQSMCMTWCSSLHTCILLPTVNRAGGCGGCCPTCIFTVPVWPPAVREINVGSDLQPSPQGTGDALLLEDTEIQAQSLPLSPWPPTEEVPVGSLFL